MTDQTRNELSPTGETRHWGVDWFCIACPDRCGRCDPPTPVVCGDRNAHEYVTRAIDAGKTPGQAVVDQIAARIDW